MGLHKTADPSECHPVPATAISGTTAAAKAGHGVLLGGGTYTLPTPGSDEAYAKIFIDYGESWDSTSLVFNRTAGGNIDGVGSNKTISKKGGAVILAGDGTNWFTRELGAADDSEFSILVAQIFS